MEKSEIDTEKSFHGTPLFLSKFCDMCVYAHIGSHAVALDSSGYVSPLAQDELFLL